MTATVLLGSDGQACWRFTVTDGQHKNRQFLTTTGQPRLAAATLLAALQKRATRSACDGELENYNQISLLLLVQTNQRVLDSVLTSTQVRFTADRMALYGSRDALPIPLYVIIGRKLPRLKCYKHASRLNRYNIPTDNAIDFLFSTLHSEMV